MHALRLSPVPANAGRYILVCLALLTPAFAAAQDVSQAPAHVAVVDGNVSLDRDGQTESASAGVPFVVGDRIRTDQGRIEVLFPDGSALDIDQFSAIDLLSPTLLRMTEGRVLLTVAGAGRDTSSTVRYQIDTPVASAITSGPGEFRVALLTGASGVETELAVLRGTASLATERGSVEVRAGERTLARDNQSPLYPQVFNSARFDAFDRWAEARRFDRTRTTAASSYLPNDLYMYGSTFDRYGAWSYEQPYGNVWYPNVGLDWQPYYNGYWSSIRPYGWTWIGFDSWSWPTHHYGRWGHARNRWFWIPERRWASAWVSWGAAPGYVSWCPLGFDNRPVYALSVTVGSPWAGWVIIPRTHFGGYPVTQWAVPSHRIHSSTPFLTLASSPVPATPRYAVPRAVVDGGSGGRVAIPRNGGGRAQVAGAQVAGASPAAGGRMQSGAGSPVAIERSPAGRTSDAVSAPPSASGRTGQAILRNPEAAGRQPAATEPLIIDRSQSGAVPRRAPESRLETPGSAAAPVDRFRTPVERQPGDGRFRQSPPLPQTAPLPQSPPLATTPLYRNPGSAIRRDDAGQPPATYRSPGAAIRRDDAPQAQPSGEVVPRWNRPGAVSAPSSPQDSGAPPAAPARSATPRWEGYSRPAPAPQSAPPPSDAGRPAPSRSPGSAVPRSAPSSSPPSEQAPSSSGSGDRSGGGGGRQRRP